jgi:PLP dependent protein
MISENIKTIAKDLPPDVTLIAVSKTRTVEEMKEAYDVGIRDFGENKVQEIQEKYEAFGETIRWHLIGHLQRNKVKYILGKVHLIHSLDSVKLLNEIETQCSKKDLTVDALIQINIGREESKSGILIEDLDNLLKECGNCKFVNIKGLMSIIPKGDEDSCRSYFKELKTIWNRLKGGNYQNVEMKYLSMGMSEDYKIAVQEGSNMIRVGQGIFGKRNYNI